MCTFQDAAGNSQLQVCSRIPMGHGISETPAWPLLGHVPQRLHLRRDRSANAVTPSNPASHTRTLGPCGDRVRAAAIAGDVRSGTAALEKPPGCGGIGEPKSGTLPVG